MKSTVILLVKMIKSWI